MIKKMSTKSRRATITEENIEESRRLRAIWDRTPDRPSQAVFGETYNIGNQSAVGHFLNGTSALSMKAAKGFAKGLNCSIGEFSPRLAREAMDQLHALDKTWEVGAPRGVEIAGLEEKVTTRSTLPPDSLSIPEYNVAGRMGLGGLVLRDQPGVIHSWNVSPEWVQKNVRSHSGVQNLCIVTGFGDSMKGMFNPGDPLLVDKGVTTVELDAVYFFRVEGEGFIKRLQRIPGEGIRVISTNKEYETWTIKKGMEFQVLARVLRVWEGTDL